MLSLATSYLLLYLYIDSLIHIVYISVLEFNLIFSDSDTLVKYSLYFHIIHLFSIFLNMFIIIYDQKSKEKQIRKNNCDPEIIS